METEEANQVQLNRTDSKDTEEGKLREVGIIIIVVSSSLKKIPFSQLLPPMIQTTTFSPHPLARPICMPIPPMSMVAAPSAVVIPSMETAPTSLRRVDRSLPIPETLNSVVEALSFEEDSGPALY